MKKTFKRNSRPIEIEIEDVDGELHVLNSRIVFTNKNTAKIEEIVFQKDVSWTTKITEQMILIFGRDEEFYNKFETVMLGEVIQFVSEQIYNSKKK